MATVAEFYDMVMYNENHTIRLKSVITDEVILQFNSVWSLENCGYANHKIKQFSTDWREKVYILWV